MMGEPLCPEHRLLFTDHFPIPSCYMLEVASESYALNLGPSVVADFGTEQSSSVTLE